MSSLSSTEKSPFLVIRKRLTDKISTFLNNLKLIKLAVSLGSTESLAEHPYTMTHVDVADEFKEALNISDKLVRLSVGVEFHGDIIMDIEQALACI